MLSASNLYNQVTDIHTTAYVKDIIADIQKVAKNGKTKVRYYYTDMLCLKYVLSYFKGSKFRIETGYSCKYHDVYQPVTEPKKHFPYPNFEHKNFFIIRW